MSNALRKEVGDAIERGASIDEMVGILRKYRDQGMTARDAAEALEAMQADADERTEDRLLEILDIVTGFCQPELRVWE